ncbi:MAG: TonB family protein [Elusimicrobiota bacterium]|jgi:TonB family protein
MDMSPSAEQDSFTRKDLGFWTAAVLLHAFLLVKDPSLFLWSAAVPPEDKSIPVQFVEAPSASLAPMPASAEEKDAVPAYGPGVYRPEQLKAGLPEPKKLARKAAVKKPALTPQELELRKRLREERLARRQEEKERRIQLAQEKARLLAEKRAEKARLLAEARAEKARRRAELQAQLAMLPSPDEQLSDAPAGAAPAAAGLAVGRSEAASLLNGLSEPALKNAEGRGGTLSENVRPSGGGPAQDGGGAAWSLEGPIGNRRLLHREIPRCPDWVAERGLDLSVQIRFQVLSDGSVHRAAAVRRTSGFPDLDRRALDALLHWRFEPIPGKSAPDTWGVVTLRFTTG